MFLDDIADMSFYRLVRWSSARVTVHSGREVVFDDKVPPVFPCRAQFKRDNETLLGIRMGKEDIENDAAVYDESDEKYPDLMDDDDVDPDAADGEETTEGPRSVEFEPFPQDVLDQLTL